MSSKKKMTTYFKLYFILLIAIGVLACKAELPSSTVSSSFGDSKMHFDLGGVGGFDGRLGGVVDGDMGRTGGRIGGGVTGGADGRLGVGAGFDGSGSIGGGGGAGGAGGQAYP